MIRAAYLVFLLCLWSLPGVAQEYVGVEPEGFTLDLGPVQSTDLTLRKSDGQVIAAPWLDEQLGFESVQISPDHRRVGWIVLKKNVCCADPVGLVIFTGDRIERVLDQCITRWMFGSAGSVITYWTEPCHNASAAQFIMMDTATGQWIAHYEFDYQILNDTDGELPADAPDWVRKLYGHD